MADQAADFLLINNNNTRTKFALADRSSVRDHRSILSEDVSADSVQSLLEGWNYGHVMMASVVPRDQPSLRDSQAGIPLLEISPEIPLGIEIDFPEPAMIGADRLANAAAVADRCEGRPIIVVDFGTAVTFDIIDPRPAYVGGVIAPGLDAMRHYLHQRTALLPEIEIVHPDSAIGKSTEHAMQSGAFHGYRGLLREILSQIESELESPAKVIATGGYAALLADKFEEISSVEPYLTMEGLRRVALLNFP